MNHELEARIVDILSHCREMVIATVRPDGGPQVTTVSFVNDGLLIYFACAANSLKAENLAFERRVSMAVTPPYSGWANIQGLSMSGAAGEVTLPREKAAVANVMAERFPDVAELARHDPRAVKLFCVRLSRVSIVDYSRGFAHSEVVMINADDITNSRLNRPSADKLLA